MTTNGVFLDRLALPLRRAGLNRVNISLDSLDSQVFAAVTGRDRHGDVLAGIEAALAVGFHPVKINIVALKGVNGDETSTSSPSPSRGAFSCASSRRCRWEWPTPGGPTTISRATTSPAHRGRLPARARRWHEWHEQRPRRTYRVTGTGTEIGFITPMSNSFCSRATGCGSPRRLRPPCLSPCDELDLRVPLRGGGDDGRSPRSSGVRW